MARKVGGELVQPPSGQLPEPVVRTAIPTVVAVVAARGRLERANGGTEENPAPARRAWIEKVIAQFIGDRSRSVLLPVARPPEQPSTPPPSPSRALATQPSLAACILGDRHQQSKQATGCGQKGASLPILSPPTALRDLSTTQGRACWQEHIQKETTARGAWKINYGHKYLKEGPMPRKRLHRARLRLALGAGPLAVTSSPESKEVQDGRPETKGVRHQLSRGVGVQGSPPKGDKVWETQRGPQGPAVQTRPEGLEMRQVLPSTLQLLFQGISHDGQGRASYLRERHRRSRRSFCTRSCHPGSTAGTWGTP
ncbi:uncharacterized protein LOC118005503 [Mirounga leonina]|uniref:uncharacterized protein LOC118005503 n=1 Tax=Mirounga leonina TaxID=9715 RepID=UPI00156BE22C|nr:uncharacterized protein LOC118005503 [Mirounga leonina]